VVPKLAKDQRVSIYTFPVLMLIVIVGISFLGLGLVMPLRALYGRQIGASSTEIGLMTTSFLLAGFLATPGIGWLSDHFGYKNVLWLFLAGFSLTGVIFCVYSLPSVTAWPIILISIGEGVVTSLARTSLDGLLADVIPHQALGKVQANFSAAGLIGNLLGATAAGLLYGFSIGLPFLIEGLILLGASLVLLLPAIARTFLAARRHVQAEHAESEQVGEPVLDR
jgi:MFS transporter, DHA1 family, solute carrier family 18 (vesicular amine transporter), member 1/2